MHILIKYIILVYCILPCEEFYGNCTIIRFLCPSRLIHRAPNNILKNISFTNPAGSTLIHTHSGLRQMNHILSPFVLFCFSPLFPQGGRRRKLALIYTNTNPHKDLRSPFLYDLDAKKGQLGQNIKLKLNKIWDRSFKILLN